MDNPQLHSIADRSYELTSDVDAAIVFFNHLFTYAGAGRAEHLWMHRWRHDGPAGRTMIVLFKPHGDSPPRLSLLGPKVDEVDQLAVEEVQS